MVKLKIACSDVGLNWLINSAIIRRLWIHMRITVNNKLVKIFIAEYVSKLSRLMRVIYGWCCVYDVTDTFVDNANKNTIT